MGEESNESVEEQPGQEQETQESTVDSSNVTYNKVYQMAVSGNIDYDSVMEMAVKADVGNEDYSQLEEVLEQAVQDGKITNSDASKFKQAMISFTKDIQEFYANEYNSFTKYARQHSKDIKIIDTKEVTDELPTAVAYTDTDSKIGANSRYDEMLDEMRGQYGSLNLVRDYVAKYIIAHELAHTGQSHDDLNREPAPAAAEYDVENFLKGYFQYRAEHTQGKESEQYSGLAKIAEHRANILKKAINQYDSTHTYSETLDYTTYNNKQITYNPKPTESSAELNTIKFPTHNSLDELIMRHAA